MMTKNGDVLVNSETHGGGVFRPPIVDTKKGVIGDKSVSLSSAARKGRIGAQLADSSSDNDSAAGGDTLSSEDLQQALNLPQSEKPNLPPLLSSGSESPFGNKPAVTRPRRVTMRDTKINPEM